MGLTEPALYDADEQRSRARCSATRELSSACASEGWMRLDYPTPFVPFADGFPTPSGQARVLLRDAPRADGHDPLPGYTPPRTRPATGTRSR